MLPLVLSCGDPSGIGLEIAFKAWLKRQGSMLSPFFLLGDPDVVRARADMLGLAIPFHCVDDTALAVNFADSLPVLPLINRQQNAPGQPLAANAAGTIEAIERAVGLVMQKQAAALVTCPIAKKPLYDSGFAFPGHTEFLAHLARQTSKKIIRPVMMLAGPQLRTVPVTVHTALRRVADAISMDLIVEIARITAHDLRHSFGIERPRLAIAGLNPHAGEDGSMGDEEITFIKPAISILQKEGLDVQGPFPADTLFHERARKHYDAALCMYHDQALIPVKTIDFDKTVNVTLGLPFIRTSPDHGTAFDIATQGIANPDSLIAALQMAAAMVKARGISNGN